MSRRSAFTLTELVVTMSAGSTLMVLALGMIHQTMTLASISRQRADNDRSMHRLVEQFRDDVHRADHITVEASERMQIELAGDGQVTYRISDDAVVRQQSVPGGERKESYLFTAGTFMKFGSQEEPLRATLTIEHETGLHGVAPRVDRHVAAVVGFLSRHESGMEATP